MSAPWTRDIGTLDVVPALLHPELLAPPVYAALATWPEAEEVGVAAIDPAVSDTAAFCERYGVTPEQSANCVIVTGRREGVARLAACVVLASTRADVNGVVRQRLNVRKASFASTETAVEASGMEYGGITPLGLPGTWPLLVDAAAAAAPLVIVGSGVRRSKLVLPGATLGRAPAAEVLTGLGRPVAAPPA